MKTKEEVELLRGEHQDIGNVHIINMAILKEIFRLSWLVIFLPISEQPSFHSISVSSQVEKAINNIQHWTLTQLKVFMTLCIKKYYSAITEPGTAVGALGGQVTI